MDRCIQNAREELAAAEEALRDYYETDYTDSNYDGLVDRLDAAIDTLRELSEEES